MFFKLIKKTSWYTYKCCFIVIVLKNTLEKHLEKEIPVVAVVAVMGTTEESSIDPLTEILKIRKDFSKKVRYGPALQQFIYLRQQYRRL